MCVCNNFAQMIYIFKCVPLAILVLLSTTSVVGAESNRDANRNLVELLLGNEDGVDTFFEDHFGIKHFLVDDSMRENRFEWMSSHRRFLRNEDVDALLKMNSSARHDGQPLRLGEDVDLFRIAKEGDGFWGRSRLASFYTKAETERAFDGSEMEPIGYVDYDKVHQAFTDGFEIVVYNMQYRSPEIHKLADALSQYWMVPVSAALHFVPPRLNQIKDRAPVFYAEDMFIVQLDGEQSVALFKDTIRGPSPDDLLQSKMRAAVAENLEGATPEERTLKEGDVLYVPRGYALDWRTDQKISLHVALRLETHRCSVMDGILAAIDQGEKLSVDEENPLLFLLNPEDHTTTFADVLRVSARVAADVTAEMQAYVAVGRQIAAAMEDADSDKPEIVLRRHIDSFVEAGQEALFRPVIEALSEQYAKLTEPAEGMQGAVAAWAHELHTSGSAAETGKIEAMFKKCLLFLHDHSTMIATAARRSMVDAHEASERKERPERLKRIATSLRRHGHEVHSDEL
jgi:Cupin superfamily protein